MDPIRPPLRRDDPSYWAMAIALLTAAAVLLFGLRLLPAVAPPSPAPAAATVALSGGLLAVLSGVALSWSAMSRRGAREDARGALYAFAGVVLVGVGASLVAWAVRIG